MLGDKLGFSKKLGQAGPVGFRKFSYIFLFSMVFVSLVGCGGASTNNENVGATCAGVVEEPYCSTVASVNNGVSITGVGQYYYRPTSVTNGLSGNPVAGKISFSEVVIKNSAGQVVQCGNTGAQGSFSLAIPKTAGTYTLSINSRADNGSLKASVLKEICANQYYSISQSFTVTASDSSTKDIGVLSAYARTGEDSEIKGGAFNILKDLYKVNEFIRQSIGDTSWVAPKVAVYWQAGFNPNSYRSPDYANLGVSFYSTGNRKLYILGGISGLVNLQTVDTDHFDDSIIIHEYGHFLEDVYAKQDSPGGSHSGNSLIDARLSWSEGWANFLQSAVLTNWDETAGVYSANANFARGKYYLDTAGYSGDSVETGESGAVNISFDLTLDGGSALQQDAVSLDGEGTFREMSISRELYKVISSSALVTLGADIPFSALWTAFSSSTQGLSASSSVFRNVGLFNSFLNSIVTTSYSGNLTKWNAVIGNEKQNITTVDYGNGLSAQSAACSIPSKTILPLNDVGSCSTSSGTSSTSNKLRSNDFYSFYHDGSNTGITLNYVAASSKAVADLDLYLYKYVHQYFEDCHETFGYQFADFGGAVRSARRNPSGGDSGSEFISLAGLPVGYYLLNVKAYTLGLIGMTARGSTYSLQISTSGATNNLCPQN